MAKDDDKLDEVIGRALRNEYFRERLAREPDVIAKEMGLDEREIQVFAQALAIGSSLFNPGRVMFCTAKTCNEKGAARMPETFWAHNVAEIDVRKVARFEPREGPLG